MITPKIRVLNTGAKEVLAACFIEGNICCDYAIGLDVCCDFVAVCGSDFGPPCNSCDQVHYMPRG